MYTTQDDDIYLAAESVISGVLASELADDPTADLDFGDLTGADWADLPDLD